MALSIPSLPIGTELFGLTDKTSPAYIAASTNKTSLLAGAEGLSGFLFDVPDTEKINLSTDITDHYTQSKEFMHDHSVNKPAVITLTGFVGEVVFRKGSGLTGVLDDISNKLSALPAFTGGQTNQAVQVAQKALTDARSIASTVENIAGKVGSAGKAIQAIVDGVSEPSKQQIAFQKLYQFQQARAVLTLQTPWFYFDSVMITSLEFSQGATTTGITDIKVTLKEVRFASFLTEFSAAGFAGGIPGGRSSIQAASMVDGGSQDGKKQSVLFKSPEIVYNLLGIPK